MSALDQVLLVDLYELTMAEAYRRRGIADLSSTFSLFVRDLPPTRGYLVAAGLDDALRWLEAFRFEPDTLASLARLELFAPEFLDWLSNLRFTGSVRAVPEGSIVFAGEPLLEVDAPIAEAQLAETFLLNQITLQTTLASKAARIMYAADGRAVIDFALRRTQGIDAGMKLARVCRLVGLAGTSNVAGALEYDVAASGTMAHSFIQAFEGESDAFRAFAAVFGDRTILLVDTHDTARGVEHAVTVALELRGRGVHVRGIRLDSGDLGALATAARRRLDDAGLSHMQIFASGDLDEHRIDELVRIEHAPIDGFGVGSSLGVASDAPTLDTVYKLAQFDGRPVRKTSTRKATWPGAKQVWRSPDWSGDVLSLAHEPPPGARYRALLREAMRGGERTGIGTWDLDQAHAHFVREWNELPSRYRDLDAPEPYEVRASTGLLALTRSLDAKDRGD